MLEKNLAAQICELHTMSWEFRGVPDEVQTEKRVWADPMSPGKEQGYSKRMCNSKLQNSLKGMPCLFWSFVATMTASYKKIWKTYASTVFLPVNHTIATELWSRVQCFLKVVRRLQTSYLKKSRRKILTENWTFKCKWHFKILSTSVFNTQILLTGGK